MANCFSNCPADWKDKSQLNPFGEELSCYSALQATSHLSFCKDAKAAFPKETVSSQIPTGNTWAELASQGAAPRPKSKKLPPADKLFFPLFLKQREV